MLYITISIIILYIATVCLGVYIFNAKNKNINLINNNEKQCLEKIQELEKKLNNSVQDNITKVEKLITDINPKFQLLSTQIASGLTELGQPITSKFTEIKRDINDLKEFFNKKEETNSEQLTEFNNNILSITDTVQNLKSDLTIIQKYFVEVTNIQEKIKKVESDFLNVSNESQIFKSDIIELQQKLSELKVDFNSFRLDSINVKNLDAQVFDMNNTIIKIQQDINKFRNKLKNKENTEINELKEIINPNDIIVDEQNVKQQYQQIIDFNITPKIKQNNKKIEDMIDNGEIIIKGMN